MKLNILINLKKAYEYLFIIISYPKLHAAYFTYRGTRYMFSGWWMLEWDDGNIFYDTIDDFLKDNIFDGKRFEEIVDKISDVFFDHEP